MGLFSKKVVRTTTTRRVTSQQSGSMGSFGGKGKLVTGSKLSGGKSKRNPR
jgi:hypothetical protein